MAQNKLIINSKHTKGEDGYKVFYIRIKNSLVSRIEEISSQTGRRWNELIGIFPEYALGHRIIENDSEP